MTDEPDQDEQDVQTIELSPPDGDGAAVTTQAGVTRFARPETRWLSTGANGGQSAGPAAYNITVPEGWDRTALDTYVDERLEGAGFDEQGPALLTGVDQQHARVARAGPVTVLATAGVSNPAPLLEREQPTATDRSAVSNGTQSPPEHGGTVNVLVVVDRQLRPAAQANLLTVVAEAKAATLLDIAGVPGTTTDAVIVGSAAGGTDSDPVRFTGSATPVGAAVRCCTRDALQASLKSRYAETDLPDSVEAADHGIRVVGDTVVSLPTEGDQRQEIDSS